MEIAVERAYVSGPHTLGPPAAGIMSSIAKAPVTVANIALTE